MTLKVNANLLKEWLIAQKKNNPQIRVDLLKATRIAPSTLSGILYANRVPNPQVRLLLAQFTGLDESELFPQAEEKEAA